MTGKEEEKYCFIEAATPQQWEAARILFLEYANSLHFSLCFQGFSKEIEDLPAEYSPPEGCIIICYIGGKPVGCAGLRLLTTHTCEMKRMYVQPGYRGKGIGKMLANMIIQHACRAGFKTLRLDTLESMKEAVHLYHKLGFYEIEAYRHNPVKGAIYMELALHKLRF